MAPILGIMASQISGHLWAPSGAFDSIATATVGAGGSTTVSFSSIPQTYKHLQIRCFYKTSGTGANMKISYNSGAITLANSHYLFGDGSAIAGRDTGGPIVSVQAGNAANTFYAQVFDLFDYTSTSKNQTLRTFGGGDLNTAAGCVYLMSGLSTSTTAINQITLSLNTADSYSQYSSFALYGIKGD